MDRCAVLARRAADDVWPGKARPLGWRRGYAALVAAVLARATDPTPALAWVPIAHRLVLAVVCGLTGMLPLGLASATGRRGYLVLGSTCLYVGALLIHDQMVGGRGGAGRSLEPRSLS